MTPVHEEPPKEAFLRSRFDCLFRIPNSFEPAAGDRAYLETDGGKAAYCDLAWRHNTDWIVVRKMVVPDVVWQLKTPEQMFAGAKMNILEPRGAHSVYLTDKGGGMSLVSERRYQIGQCPACSFVLFVAADEPHFERSDYILARPDLYVFMYSSPTKESLQGALCNELFNSIRIKPMDPRNEVGDA